VDPRVDRPGTARLRELDGLRGLAALSVVFYHWLLVDPSNPGGPVGGSLTSGMNWLYATPLGSLVAGPQMVLLFFVLSGMVLSLPRLSGRKVPYGRYVLIRAGRLYPAAWAAAALSGLGLLVLPMSARPGLPWWLSVTLQRPFGTAASLHFATLIGAFDPSQLDGPMWSLEQELRVSLLLPLLVFVVRRCHWSVVFAIASGLIIGGTLAVPVGTYLWAWTPAVVGCFLLGSLIARHRRWLVSAWAWIPGAGQTLLLLGVLVTFWIPARGTGMGIPGYLLTLIPVLGACILIVGAQVGRTRRALTRPTIGWLGRISYSLYLLHVVVLRVLVVANPLRVPLIVLAPIGIGITLLLATVMQRYVEAPALAFVRRANFRRAALLRLGRTPAPALARAGQHPRPLREPEGPGLVANVERLF
jgi:peptidoglycan/LPS O-acetylase OafA/YrhL